VFTPANVSRSLLPAPSSPGAARRRRAPPLARRRCAGVAASLLGPVQWRRLLLLPLTAPSQVEWKGKTSMGLVAWMAGPLRPPSLLNPGAATTGRNPLAAPAWSARATEAAPLPPLRRLGHRGVWRGGKRGFSRPIRVRLAREHARSLGVRAAWLARPSHRALPARCGSVDPPPGKGEGEREEGKGKTVTDEWALPGSERGEG
jgi:hypothetical protein